VAQVKRWTPTGQVCVYVIGLGEGQIISSGQIDYAGDPPRSAGLSAELETIYRGIESAESGHIERRQRSHQSTAESHPDLDVSRRIVDGHRSSLAGDTGANQLIGLSAVSFKPYVDRRGVLITGRRARNGERAARVDEDGVIAVQIHEYE